MIHNNWSATFYGHSSLRICDEEGKVIYHSVAVDQETCTEEWLIGEIERFQKERQ